MASSVASKAAKTMAVIRYPRLTAPKNYNQAAALFDKWAKDYTAALPPAPFQSSVHTKEDLIRKLKTSPFADIQQLGNEAEKSTSALEAQFTVPKSLQKDHVFPIDLWKTVLPSVYVDAYKKHLDKQYIDKWNRSDVLPLTKDYLAYLDHEKPKFLADLARHIEEYKTVKPQIEAAERRLLALERNEISIEALFEENPDIAAEVAEELEKGDWSHDGSGSKPEAHHH